MKTPDITLAQVLALLGWIGSQAVAFGVLSNSREQLLVSVGSTVIAAAWKLADAVIRAGRSKSAGVSELSDIVAMLTPLLGDSKPAS